MLRKLKAWKKTRLWPRPAYVGVARKLQAEGKRLWGAEGRGAGGACAGAGAAGRGRPRPRPSGRRSDGSSGPLRQAAPAPPAPSAVMPKALDVASPDQSAYGLRTGVRASGLHVREQRSGGIGAAQKDATAVGRAFAMH